MSSRSSSLVAILIGAALGGAAGYLYFTPSGKRTRLRIEPWLDDLTAEIRRVRSVAAKARVAMDEGRHSLEAVWDASTASGPLSFEEEGPEAS